MSPKKPPRRSSAGRSPDFAAMLDLCEAAISATGQGQPEEVHRLLGRLAGMLYDEAKNQKRPFGGDPVERAAALWVRIYHERDGMGIGEAANHVINNFMPATYYRDEHARSKAVVRITRMSSNRTPEVRQFLGLRKQKRN